MGEPDWEIAQSDQEPEKRHHHPPSRQRQCDGSHESVRLHSEDGEPAGRLSLQEAEMQPNHQSGTRISSALKELEQKGYLSNKQRLSLPTI